MEKTLFALSLGFVGLILVTQAASGTDRNQSDNPSQISLSDTPKSAPVSRQPASRLRSAAYSVLHSAMVAGILENW